MDYFEYYEFGWVPAYVADACDESRERWLTPSIRAFAESLVGGVYCR